MSEAKCGVILVGSALAFELLTEIFSLATAVFVLMAVCVFIYVFKSINAERYKKKLISAHDPFELLEEKKWLGFSRKMDIDGALSWASKIGLIPYCDIAKKKAICDYVYLFQGNWFREISEIGFRFEMGSERLMEIRFKQERIETWFTIEEEYKKLSEWLTNKYGPSKQWKNMGIQLCTDEKRKKDFIYITFFFD